MTTFTTAMSLPQPFESLPQAATTGTRGVRVTGRTPEETLGRLVLALTQVLSGGAPVECRGEGAIELPGSPDLAVAAVDVLREVCQRFFMARQLACGVEVLSATPPRLRLRLAYGDYDPAVHRGAPVRAVLYHGARFEPFEHGYRAEVTLEI